MFEALKAKRELAEGLLPHVKPLLEKQMATASGNRYQELKELHDGFRQIAEHFHIDWNSL